MKSFLLKYILIIGLIVMTMFGSSCHRDYPPQQQYGYQPQAQLGYQDGQYGAYVTDARGEQFFMEYLLFMQLHRSGGYNAVSSYYYDHPGNTSIRPYMARGFRAANTQEARNMSGQFTSSYDKATRSNSLYTPPATAISSSLKARQSKYGAAYHPTNAQPTIEKATAVKSSFGGALARPPSISGAATARPSSFGRATTSSPTRGSVPSVPSTSRPSSFGSSRSSVSSSSRPSSFSSSRSSSSSSSRSSSFGGRH